MQVKVFEATDMASGLRKIRRELGPDALILSTRTIKSGRLGVLGKECLEITAAIDNQWPEQAPHASSAGSQRAIGNNGTRAYHNAQALAASCMGTSPEHKPEYKPEYKPEQSDDRLAGATKPDVPPPDVPPPDVPPAATDRGPELRREFDELKSMVKNLAGELSRMGARDEERAQAPAQVPAMDALASLEQKLRASKSVDRDHCIEDLLLSHGINQETARIMADFAGESLTPDARSDTPQLYGFLQKSISDIITTTPLELHTAARQKRMAFVGPTGVGKTTTLAKIAARYLAQHSSSIALITIDTYRIAAVEQLKVYGEIMHLPVEVVINQHQLIDALDRHDDKELVLIDTAGRSPRDSLSIEEIQSFFTPELHIENHLVLSATTRDSELLATLKKFSGFSLHSTIFTKIDECSHLGVLLNTQIHNPSPVSCITNGQRVPEDILEADRQQLAKLIVPTPAAAADAADTAATTTAATTAAATPAETADSAQHTTARNAPRSTSADTADSPFTSTTQPGNTTGKVQE
ncbi:MAG: flagellar biosynthesis protein FlhF [Desulfopila sp.]